MKKTYTLFKHYCVVVKGCNGETTMRFRTEEEAIAFRKGIIYASIYGEDNYTKTSKIFIDYLGIEIYD